MDRGQRQNDEQRHLAASVAHSCGRQLLLRLLLRLLLLLLWGQGARGALLHEIQNVGLSSIWDAEEQRTDGDEHTAQSAN